MAVISPRMVAHEPDWALYRTFLAVIRHGSLSAAARALQSTQPTVGRQIEVLEAALEASLFTRSPKGLVPTAAALNLVPHVEAMGSAAEAVRRASSADAQDEVGTIRLTMGELMGLEVLPPILADFSFRYPRIKLELSLTNRNEDLLRRDADIAIRMMRPTQKDLAIKKVGSLELGLYAHRRYLDMFGEPATVADLADHRAIGFDRDLTPLLASGPGAVRLSRADFSVRTDNIGAQMAALRSGLGIGVCQINIARRDADLIRVLEDQVSFRREVWLAVHSSAKGTRRIRLLFDHLARGLSDYVRGAQSP